MSNAMSRTMRTPLIWFALLAAALIGLTALEETGSTATPSPVPVTGIDMELTNHPGHTTGKPS